MKVINSCWVVIALTLLSIGCSKDDPISVPDLPLPPSVKGTWFGSNANILALTLTMDQSGVNVLGSGVIQGFNANGDSMTSPGSVSGSNHYPNVALTFHVTGYQPVQITGQFVSTSRLDLLLNQSGFSNSPLILEKE